VGNSHKVSGALCISHRLVCNIASLGRQSSSLQGGDRPPHCLSRLPEGTSVSKD